MPDTVTASPRTGDYWVLDVFHLGTAVVVMALVALDAETRGGDRLVALSALGATLVAYGLIGRVLLRAGVQGRRSCWVYLGGVVALFALACWDDARSAWFLFSFCTQAFTLLPLWSGVAVVAIGNLLPPAADLLAPRQATAAASTGLLRAAAVTAAAALSAAWVDSVARRSAERADLVHRLQDSQAQVAELSRRAGTDAERSRLSGEIHDTLAQGFLSILTLLRAASATVATDPQAAQGYLDLAQASARDNLAEARSMVAALAPPALEEAGLVGAVRRRAQRFQQETGALCTVEVGTLPELCRDAEVVLLRAAQELLTNAEKHARASRVTVHLAAGTPTPAGAATVVLTVTDDGNGPGDGADPGVLADTAPTSGTSGGYGLPTMRHRAEALGGSVRIQAAAAGGTVAVVTVLASPTGSSGTLPE